jgi:hypothetical protein
MVGSDVIALRHQFEALGLIETVSKQGDKGTSYVAWTPTEKGRKYASLKKAIRKSPAANP